MHHGNTQIRQIAAENLVGYSTAQPALFKRNQLEPVKDLKLLIKDYNDIAKNALTILVNISDDEEVCDALISDDLFLESLLRRVTVCYNFSSSIERRDMERLTSVSPRRRQMQI